MLRKVSGCNLPKTQLGGSGVEHWAPYNASQGHAPKAKSWPLLSAVTSLLHSEPTLFSVVDQLASSCPGWDLLRAGWGRVGAQGILVNQRKCGAHGKDCPALIILPSFHAEGTQCIWAAMDSVTEDRSLLA